MKKTVYGPVPSFRLGRSIGVDLISREDKVCPFDCTYCQLGKTEEKTTNRGIFVETDLIRRDLPPVLEKTEADIVTFSGTGEPTLAKNLSEVVEAVKGLTDLPIAILTNSSTIFLDDVQISLAKFDKVVAKLDSPNEELFQKINIPSPGLSYARILEGLKHFRDIYGGDLALQMMFTGANKNYADALSDIALDIGPEEVHINTPTRPCPVKPLDQDQIEEINEIFEGKGLKTISVYKKEGPVIEPVDITETLIRRPVI